MRNLPFHFCQKTSDSGREKKRLDLPGGGEEVAHLLSKGLVPSLLALIRDFRPVLASIVRTCNFEYTLH